MFIRPHAAHREARGPRSAPARGRRGRSPPTHSATTPWRLSSEGDSAMSRMFTPAPPSASAMLGDHARAVGNRGAQLVHSSPHPAASPAPSSASRSARARSFQADTAAASPGCERRAHLAQALGEPVDAGDQGVAVRHVDVRPDRAVRARHARRVAEARTDRRQALLVLPAKHARRPGRRAGWRARAADARRDAIRRSWVSASIAVGCAPKLVNRRCSRSYSTPAVLPRAGVRYQVAPSNRSSRACSTPAVSAPARGCPPMKRSSATPASAMARLVEPTSVTTHVRPRAVRAPRARSLQAHRPARPRTRRPRPAPRRRCPPPARRSRRARAPRRSTRGSGS